MRRVILFVLSIVAATAFAQRAPDIPRGMTAAEVVRLYGWPKGKSATNDRENWLYEKFQVTLSDGRVIAVTYVSSAGASSVRPHDAVRIGAAPVPPSAAGAPGATLPSSVRLSPEKRPQVPVEPPSPERRESIRSSPAHPSPGPGLPIADRSQKGGSVSKPAPTSISRRVDRIQSSDANRSSGSGSWFTAAAAGVTGLLIVLGTLVALRLRARSFSGPTAAPLTPVPAVRRSSSWQDSVAERLRAANAAPIVPPVLSPPVAPSDLPANLERRMRHPSAPPTAAVLTVALLRDLEWKRFELIVQLYYQATGVRAELTCAGADGGVDVKLYRAGSDQPYGYVQCKAWGSRKVTLRDVREFLGVMAADRIGQGVYVTTSDFWPDARSFAQANGIFAFNASNFVAKFAALPAGDREHILATVTKGDFTTPSCPKCEAKAVSRERKRGGVKFWACRCGWTMTARGEAIAHAAR